MTQTLRFRKLDFGNLQPLQKGRDRTHTKHVAGLTNPLQSAPNNEV